jgi:hypothetical protein
VPVKLHRCSATWMKIGAHPCWVVESALRDAGVDYVSVTGPLRRGKRTDIQGLTGQTMYPVIQFEDGSWYRAESKEMAAKIRAGELGSSGAGPDST